MFILVKNIQKIKDIGLSRFRALPIGVSAEQSGQYFGCRLEWLQNKVSAVFVIIFLLRHILFSQ